MPLSQLIQRVSSYMHAYTLYSSVRPFGVTGMIGTWSKVKKTYFRPGNILLIDFQEKGAELYCLEPSGISYGYWGCAAGKAKSNAKTELEKIKIQEMNCAELVKEAAKIIHMVHDEVKDKMFELELSWVGEFTNGVHQRVPDNVRIQLSSFCLE